MKGRFWSRKCHPSATMSEIWSVYQESGGFTNRFIRHTTMQPWPTCAADVQHFRYECVIIWGQCSASHCTLGINRNMQVTGRCLIFMPCSASKHTKVLTGLMSLRGKAISASALDPGAGCMAPFGYSNHNSPALSGWKDSLKSSSNCGLTGWHEEQVPTYVRELR